MRIWTIFGILTVSLWLSATAAQPQNLSVKVKLNQINQQQWNTLSPKITFEGETYTIETQGSAVDLRRLMQIDSADRIKNLGVTAVRMTQDGSEVKDEDTLEKILTLFSLSTYYTKQSTSSAPCHNSASTIPNELGLVLNNPLFLDQQISRFAGGELIAKKDAIRSMLAEQNPDEQIGLVYDALKVYREGSKTFGSISEVLTIANDVFETRKFSNLKSVRTFLFNLENFLDELVLKYVPVKLSKQNSRFLTVLISATLKVLASEARDQDRGFWLLRMLEEYAPNKMNSEDIARAKSVILESQNDVLTLAQVVGEYISFTINNTIVSKVEAEIVADWVKWSWKKYGTRLIGHEVASAVPAVFAGFALASLLYGLDEFFENYLMADATITYYRTATNWRNSIEQKVISSKPILDGAELESYQAALMVQQIAASRLMLHYANGINAVLSRGWLDKLNQLNKGRNIDWTAYKQQYYSQIRECEKVVEYEIGHPQSVDYLIAFINK